MKQEWLDPWIQSVGKEVCIPGNNSCSQNLKVALGFAAGEGKPKPQHLAVLFAICCRNYDSPSGIRMNNEAYTSYPVEREMLLTEGCGVYVLLVEEVVIENEHAAWADFNGKTITIVHLYTI